MSIKFNLKNKLEENHMNLSDLSNITGIRINTVSNYYNNNFKHLVMEHLNIFCKYFQCSPSEFFEYIDDDF